MEEFRKMLRKYILDYSYYDEDRKQIAIIKEKELAKLLQVDEVKFEEYPKR